MQNLVVFMQPSEDAWRTPLKGGNMILNRFCIDEDAAFELSGVNYLKKTPNDIMKYIPPGLTPVEMTLQALRRKEKGKEFSF